MRELNSSGEKSSVAALDGMADKYFTEKALGPDKAQMRFIMEAVFDHLSGPAVLELGCGNGGWTRRLAETGYDVTVVEGSCVLAENLSKTLGNQSGIKIVNSLFEEFSPHAVFDSVIASCVLEHVVKPEPFLARVRDWLKPGGAAHIVVPNAMSLHRRVGLKMGMLKDPMELSPQEIEVGHHHAYTMDKLRAQLQSAGMRVEFIKGIFLKPLNSGQMIDWPIALLEGFNKMSGELPEYTAFLYAKCGK